MKMEQILMQYSKIINYLKMQSNTSNQHQTKYNQLVAKMAKSIGAKPQDLTKVQQTVIFAHLVNIQFGLQPINRKGEAVGVPQGWEQANEGVYKINYKLKRQAGQKKENAQKIVQFRFVDNHQEDGSISINYSTEDSEQLHQYEMKYQKQKIEDNYKSYIKNLQQKLHAKKSETGGNPNFANLQPVWREPPNYNQQPNFPMPLFRPSQNQAPFNLPFTGSEYIGPENQIFRGRGTNNPLQPFNPNPHSINDPRRPPGSRYDPIDPFGSQGVDEPHTKDFMGFNQFGKPLGGNKGGFGGPGGSGPNRFL